MIKIKIQGRDLVINISDPPVNRPPAGIKIARRSGGNKKDFIYLLAMTEITVYTRWSEGEEEGREIGAQL